MRFDERCTTGQFRVSLGLSLAGLAIVVAFFAFALFKPTNQDREAYSLLVETPDDEDKKEPTLAQQKRTGVSKEIFYMRGNERLTLKVKADHSTLQLNQVGSATEIVERLSHVVGLIQEELYYRLPDGREAFLQANGRLLLRNGNMFKSQDWVEIPLSSTTPMQTLRYFEAEKAIYYYKDNHLLANQVKVAQYRIPGHKIVGDVQGLQPLMTGVASSAEISLLDGSPLFKATQMKAAFYQPEEK